MADVEMGGCDPSPSSVQNVRIPAYTVIDEESFNKEYWPKLENAIRIILSRDLGQPFNLSCEDLYSVAYKCSLQKYSETMFLRLTEIINSHVSSIVSDIEVLPPPQYLQATDLFLAQFCQSVYGLSSIFSYMDRIYVCMEFKKNMSSILNGQVAEIILSSSKVFDILKQVSSGHLEIDPQIIMPVIKGLYAINQEFAKINMTLFSRFIPNITPSCHFENLPPNHEEFYNFHEEISQNQDHERVINKRKVDEVSEDLNECRKRFAKPI